MSSQGLRHTSAKGPAEAELQSAFKAHDWQKLIGVCRRLLRKNRAHQWSHRYLGFALHKAHREEEAIQAFDQGLVFWPHDAEIMFNKAQALLDMGQNPIGLIETVLEYQPDAFLVHLKLSQALYRVQQHARGVEVAARCLELAQTSIEKCSSYIQRAIHRRELGEIRESVQDCEAAIEVEPDELTAHTNKLLFMLSLPEVTSQDIHRAAIAFAEVAEKPQMPAWPHHEATDKTPWSRIRVGFISPDFRNHSVMYFVEGILAQLDRRQFSVVGLQLNAGGDAITQRVHRHCDELIELANRPFREQKELIAAAKLDVLVDLAGHTGNNGLLLVAAKLAPLQVSWLGYPATTGLQSVDFKFTDEVTDPDGADDQYSERLFRMQTLFCCYRPQIRNPLWRYQPAYEVSASPALANGYITFGSCNNLGKLTDEVLTLWGQLLEKLPTARLLIEGKNLEYTDFRTAYEQRCATAGIPLDRLILVPIDVRNQYLTYHRIDIALDPFPLTGGTTTFDLLWMGLPLVSMVGDSFKSRLSTGILAYLGKTEWLANTPEEYLDIATRLAGDVDALNAQRLAQRDQVEHSPLMDENAFNREFGNGLRAMWIEWLAKQRHPDSPEEQTIWMDQALQEMPPEWHGPAPLGVGLKTGHRISQAEAHELLGRTLEKAKKVVPNQEVLTETKWRELTELAETVLCAIPHDPVALSCLAEVEQAHGHSEFAVTYLKYALKAMTAMEAQA